MFDAHVHFCIDGKEVSQEELKTIKNDFAKAGITRVRDMGHKTGIGIYAKKVFQNEIIVETAGYALSKIGGYGAFLGWQIGEKAEIKNVVEHLFRAGVDFIKVINSGIVTTNPTIPVSKGGFLSDELRIIVEEANNLGLKVFCHANGDKNIKTAVLAGVSSIEHGFFIQDETIHMLKEYKVEWTPTINALYSITKFIPEEEANYIKKVIDKHLKMVELAINIGVKINIGSDSGSKGIQHGESFFKELELLNKLKVFPSYN